MRNEGFCRRTGLDIIVLAGSILATGARAEAALPTAGAPPAGRVLHFPRDRYVGNLYAEDPCLGSTYAELGRDLSLPYGLNPRHVALGGDWDFLGFARGEVPVPAGRNIRLIVMLGVRKEDVRRLAAEPPLKVKTCVTDRCLESPLDLSGLSLLEPNDLYCLCVFGLVPRPDADRCVLEPIRHLKGLKILQLHNTGVTNKGLECLRELRSLRAIEIFSEPSLGNECLAVLKDLPYLEYLDLGTIATDAGFQHLGQFPSLRWLRIATGKVWGPGLAELARLPRLERLCIWGNTPLSDRHIQYLEGLTHLKSLTLWGTAAERLTDASLASIGKLTGLEELHFVGWSGPSQFTPKGVACLRNLKNLKKVDFGPAWAGPPGVAYGDEVARLLADMPSLESIKRVGYLSAEGVKMLAANRNLKCLDLGLKDSHQGYHGPTGVSHLARLGKLEELAFGGGLSLSDDDLAQLAAIRSLRNLSIGFSEATDQGMASLGKLRRLEHLTVSSNSTTTKRGLNELNGLTNLQTLCVRVWVKDGVAPDEVPLNLSALKNLQTLDLAGFALQESDLACLGGLHHVEWMTLQGNTLPEAALRHLKDLPALKRLTIDRIDCPDGSGLATLAQLPRLEDLTLRGRVTDLALGRLTEVTAPQSISAWTNEAIRPATIDYLKRTLPAIEYIHLMPLPQMDQPAAKPSSKPQSPIRTRIKSRR